MQACAQTEGYLLYPRKSYTKSSLPPVETSVPLAGSREDGSPSRKGNAEARKDAEGQKVGEAPSAETESFKRNGLLRRAQQIQQVCLHGRMRVKDGRRAKERK
eukprot:767016-Hanusia_phi.AAC.5